MVLNNYKLIRGYANAIFNVAQEYGLCNELLKFLDDLNKIINNPIMQEFLKLYCVPKAIKISCLLALLNKQVANASNLNTIVSNFLNIIVNKTHWQLITLIFNKYEQLYLSYNDTLQVKIISATELIPEQQQTLTKQLTKTLGKKLIFSYTLAPSLLGGLIIKYQDQVIDFSIKTKLTVLKNYLQNHPTSEEK